MTGQEEAEEEKEKEEEKEEEIVARRELTGEDLKDKEHCWRQLDDLFVKRVH